MSRLYYTDAYLTSFDAEVVACEPADGGYRVRLDRTAFYPTSGGQPYDLGTLNGTAVTEVVDVDDEWVAHVVASPFASGVRVQGAIDWSRRFDHMQQHTGQHILSAAFERALGVRTVSFHLGDESATIDLARDLTAAEVADAETLANRVIWEDRPVAVRFVSEEEASTLPLRKPPARGGELRLVDVTDFDLSACGGTHVRSTGAVGIVAVAGTERFKSGTRLTFVCGQRALDSHRRLRDIAAETGRLLSASGADVPRLVERLLQDGRDRSRQLEQAQGELARYRAREWRETAETIGPHLVVLRAGVDADAATLKVMAQSLTAEPGLVVIVLGTGMPVPMVAARSANAALDAGALVRAATSALGGRGGGRPELAQAGIPADVDRIVAFVRQHLAT